LKDIFGRFGHLIDVYMLGGRSCGYAKYADKDSADRALMVSPELIVILITNHKAFDDIPSLTLYVLDNDNENNVHPLTNLAFVFFVLFFLCSLWSGHYRLCTDRKSAVLG